MVEGRITTNLQGKIIGSSVEHIRDGDSVRIEDINGNILYKSKFNSAQFKSSQE